MEQLCSAYVFLTCTVYLLSVPNAGYVSITAWKYSIFLVVNIAFLAASLLLRIELVVIGVKKGAANYNGKIWIKENVVPLFCIAYLCFTCLSAVTSQYSGTFLGNTRYDGAVTIGIYILNAVLLMRQFKPNKWILMGFGVAVSFMCCIGILQFAGFNPFYLFPDGYNFYDAGIYYGGQFWSTIGNTGLCAALLSVSSAIFIVTAIRCNGIAGAMSLVPLFLSVFSIVELNVEAGVLALILGSLLMLPFVVVDGHRLVRTVLVFSVVILSYATASILVFYDGGVAFGWGYRAGVSLGIGMISAFAGLVLKKREQKLEALPPRALRRGFLLLILIVLAGGLVLVYFYDHFQGGFLAQAHEILHGNWDDDFGSGRIYIWKEVWALVKEAPFLGGGPDTLGQRGIPSFSRFSEELGTTITAGIDVAHNEYLNILVNQGALSLLPYVAVLILTCVKWWRDTSDNAVAACGCAVLFYSIQAFFGISMPITTPYLWIAIAIVNRKF